MTEEIEVDNRELEKNGFPEGDATPGKLGPKAFCGLIAAYFNLSIGTGIYSSPGPIYEGLRTAWAGILVWMGAGVIVSSGAIVYGEISLEGRGDVDEPKLLERELGPAAAYHNTLMSGIIRQTAVAAVTLSFSEHLLPLAFGADTAKEMDWSAVGITIGLIAILTLLSMVRALRSAWMQYAYLAVRMAIILFAAIGGLALLGISRTNIFKKVAPFEERYGSRLGVDGMGGRLRVSEAFQLAIWCHNGWFNIGAVLFGRARKLGRMRILAITSVMLAALLFTLVMIAYYVALDPQDIKGLSVIADYGEVVAGKVGRVGVLLLVYLVSCGATFIAVPANVKGSNYQILHPAIVKEYTKYKARILSYVINFSVSAVVTLFFKRDFVGMVVFLIVTTLITSSVTSVALVISRFRNAVEKPAITFYFAPIIFVAASACLVILSLFENTTIAVGSLATHILSLLMWRGLSVERNVISKRPSHSTSPRL